MASVPDRHRRQTYDGLELASDPADRETDSDFVVGVAPSPRTLARLTIRRRVRTALDLGTGLGIHALRVARHAERVVGIDINPRALAYAAHNAGLNGIENVDWRLGTWLEPVGDQQFDLILANPPYVISPETDLAYRDSGEPADTLVLRLLAQVPRHLEEGGHAQLLCNWVPRGGSWREPLEKAIAGADCDAVFLLYEQAEPEQYARDWNRFLSEQDHGDFESAVQRWLAYYREHDIDSIAFGLVVLRKRTGGGNWVRAIKATAGPTEGAGEHVARLFTGWDWVRAGGGQGVAEPAPGARIVRRLDLSDGSERTTYEIRPHAGFAVQVDDDVAQALARRAAARADAPPRRPRHGSGAEREGARHLIHRAGGGMSEHEHRTEEEVTEEQDADAVEDLDVPEEQSGDVGGGAQGWPIKHNGPGGK